MQKLFRVREHALEANAALSQGATVKQILTDSYGALVLVDGVHPSPNVSVHPAAEVDLPLETDPTGGLGATECSGGPHEST